MKDGAHLPASDLEPKVFSSLFFARIGTRRKDPGMSSCGEEAVLLLEGEGWLDNLFYYYLMTIEVEV